MARKALANINADPKEYNRVVDLASLLDIKLLNSSFEAKPMFFALGASDQKRSYSCVETSRIYDLERKLLLGTVVFEAGAKKGNKWTLKAKATYLIAFSVSGNPSEEGALKYLSNLGKFTCYPYFRTHFAHLCASAGAEMEPLPIMRGNIPRTIKKDALQ